MPHALHLTPRAPHAQALERVVISDLESGCYQFRKFLSHCLLERCPACPFYSFSVILIETHRALCVSQPLICIFSLSFVLPGLFFTFIFQFTKSLFSHT